MNTDLNNNLTNTQSIADDSSPVKIPVDTPVKSPRKKTMSKAALEANRLNAQKSTGPRTAAGKARSASNAFQHGLYSMKNYRHLVTHPNLVAITVHNLLEEYQPVTPTEHILLQQLIHFELRFLQMEHVCNHYMLDGKHDAPDHAYLTVLRELDRIPTRILKTIKALKALIAERGIHKEIEPIEDPPPVPTPDEYAKTNEEYAKARNKAIHPSGPEITQNVTEYIYQEFCKALDLPQLPFDQNYSPEELAELASKPQKKLRIKPTRSAVLLNQPVLPNRS